MRLANLKALLVVLILIGSAAFAAPPQPNPKLIEFFEYELTATKHTLEGFLVKNGTFGYSIADPARESEFRYVVRYMLKTMSFLKQREPENSVLKLMLSWGCNNEVALDSKQEFGEPIFELKYCRALR